MTGFLWVIVSYLLGSFPSGYIFSRLSGKDILQIGWRKTSGSNVFKNVGIWQGVATGILDVGKGYLAVYWAQKLGLAPEIQGLCGVAAVTGHNWSIFLKMAGGRGIGTLIGAFFALSPQILGYSVLPLILLGALWDAAIGTLFFLALAIYLSIYFNQFETVGVLSSVSLIPIFIKRLSPIGEIPKAQFKMILIRNRLLFDDDKPHLKLRFQKVAKFTKPLASTLMTPPKVGWKVAKQGVEIAKKPIEKLVSREPEKVVMELRPEDFKLMMMAAAKKIVFHQEEINKINVFPVADKDTGYNLAATLLGIEGVVSKKDYTSFRELAQDMQTAVMVNARGNAGMIYTGYLVEVLDRIKHLPTVDASHLALAMERGIRAARHSIAEPVEGTILDTTQAAGRKAYEVVRKKREKNIIKILEEALKESEEALKETKDKLEVLKKHNVVDAGALGFVKILEAWVENLKGETPDKEPEAEVAAPMPEAATAEPLKYPYEVVLSFRKIGDMDLERVKEELSSLGDSLDVVETEGKIKLHIHTDRPQAVIDKFKDFPELEEKTEDMAKQVKLTERKPLGLVVDEIAELPREFVEKYEIEEVKYTTRFPDGEVIGPGEDIYSKMREALKTGRPLPTTSAPPFKEFLRAYEKAFEKFQEVLVITICSKLSGAYSSARIARSTYKKPKKLQVYVFDTFTAEVAEGLIALRAQELISQAKTKEDIVKELEEFCPKVVLIGCLDELRYVVRGGRFKLPEMLLGPLSLVQKIGLRLLIELRNGRVRLLGVRFGKDPAKILAKEVELQKGKKKVKAAIAHAVSPKDLENLKKELSKIADLEIAFSASVSPVIGTHTGPGALIVAFHPIDN